MLKAINRNCCDVADSLITIPRSINYELAANAHAKIFFKAKFECWYAQQISKQLDDGKNVYDIQVPLKLSVIKLIHAEELLQLYGHLQDSPDSIIKGFKMSGMKDALTMELPLEDRFASLDG